MKKMKFLGKNNHLYGVERRQRLITRQRLPPLERKLLLIFVKLSQGYEGVRKTIERHERQRRAS